MVLPQSLLLCQTFQLMFAGTPYAVSPLPRGDCHLCCETNLEEDIIFMSYLSSGEAVRAGVEAGSPALDPSKQTVIYVHGFTEQGGGASATTVRHAFFAAGRDVNFFTMDWARLCAFPWYAEAVANAPVAGRYLTRFLERLFQDGVDPARTHVVGFSLGAEVAGFAGQSLQGYRLGRITGLDPAFPLFRWATREGHLSADDADFVDVVHTDGGDWGVMLPIGHADFYPNGGRKQQPGCSLSELHAMGQFPKEFIGCSHSRAWAYFAESIIAPDRFVALRCDSEAAFRAGLCTDRVFRQGSSNDTAVTYMGLMAPTGCRGSYYLETNDRFPFGKGMSFPTIK